MDNKNPKIKKIKFGELLAPVIVLLLIIGGFILIWPKGQSATDQSEINGQKEKPQITVFYSPTCACCKEYIPYLKRNGFEVEEKPIRDMLSIKEKYQIPSEMEACHTSVIGNYFIEGHVPVAAIKKLLEEKPEIDGIALPGMLPGSPGMAGMKTGLFKVYGLTDGKPSEFGDF